MARPANADPERTRQRLVGVATDLFARQGVGATSLRQIAREAGVTQPTISYYFGGKKGLYEATVDGALAELAVGLQPVQQVLGGIGARIDQAGDTPQALEELLEEVVRQAFRAARRHPDSLRLVMRPLVSVGDLDPRWSEGALHPFLDRGAAWLADATNQPFTSVRLNIQSVVALGMRYGLGSPGDLARLAGRPIPEKEDDATAAVAAIEDHLVSVAHTLLLGGSARLAP